MKNLLKLASLAVIAVVLFFYSKCGPGIGKFNTGREYMPDMAHSIAYEANYNTYYRFNQWVDEEAYDSIVQPRKPVAGTIARGKEVYHYGNTEEERLRATAEITSNPIPFTKAGLEKGKQLYTVYCGVCHGDKGDGNGYLYRNDGQYYPAAPKNLLAEDIINDNDGRYYHAIMYGKNVMGSYKDKLNVEERWQVISYIRFLQGQGSITSDVDAQFDNLLGVKKAEVKLDSATGKQITIQPTIIDPIGQLVNMNNVFFNTGTSSLRATSMLELDKLVAALNKYPKVKIQINGHTDGAGDPAKNLGLSQERAEQVKAYLVAAGIDATRLQTAGFGSTKPVASNGTPEGMRANRRTDLTILSR
jgi:outer membrane protein OmpA-like peptidoglycan-associated protein